MNSQIAIDDHTAAAIRSALAAAQAGQLREACEIGERRLREADDSPPLRALLGALLVQLGEHEAALGHLEAAAAATPRDPIILRNRATALVGLERFSDALYLLSDGAILEDRSQALLRLRAYAAHMGGDLDKGISDYRAYLEAHPGDWETWNNLGNAYVSHGDFPAAVDALARAAEINPRAAPTRLNLARALRDSGEIERAEAELRAMGRDFPGDANPLLDLFHLLRSLVRPEADAEEALAEAARRDPDNAAILDELGNQQIRAFQFEKAEATFRELLRLNPASVEAYLGLAQVFEHSQPHRLAALAAEAEAAGLADEGRLNLIRAFAARRSKDYEAGLSSLQTIPSDVEPAIRWHLAGQMFDSIGRYDEAFAAFAAMNDALGQNETRPLERPEELNRQLATRLMQLTPEWRDSWKSPPVPSPRPSPVFLAGFPRSGTTLLDTMLMGHERVAVLEERPIFRQLDLEFGGFDALPDMGEDIVSEMQRRYFEVASGYAEISDDTLLVDKSPLYLHRLPQILRLFPDARFILALRHPADSILSCFMLNNSIASFLDLKSAAQFYDRSFQLWERSRELFEVNVLTVVYERMVEDPETELRAVAEGLGLSWDARMLDHQKTAQERGPITTPSYAQVTQPLYNRSVGRWKNYRKQLEPILPVIEPWIRKLGYSL